MTESSIDWSAAAELVARQMSARYLRTLLPGARLGVVGWPYGVRERLFTRWHYWWQSHLLDCLVDAQIREPSPARLREIRRLARGILVRNGFRWTNSYYDDIAWLGLALQRAEQHGYLAGGRAVPTILAKLRSGWTPERGGGIAWNTAADYFNAPANGPAGILFARAQDRPWAARVAGWIDDTLADPVTGLIFDGVGTTLNRDLYTYCQGVTLGLETELALRSEDPGVHLRRIERIMTGLESEMSSGGVLIGHGGGNGGLFSGITLRYVALLATHGVDLDADLARRARIIVFGSAEALWCGRRETGGGLLFAADWASPAGAAGRRGLGRRRADGAESSRQPERDLSVQLGAWMALEAAATLAR